MRGSALPVSRDRAAGAWESTDVVYETQQRGADAVFGAHTLRARSAARPARSRAPRQGAKGISTGRTGYIQRRLQRWSQPNIRWYLLIGFFVCRGRLPGRSFFLCVELQSVLEAFHLRERVSPQLSWGFITSRHALPAYIAGEATHHREAPSCCPSSPPRAVGSLLLDGSLRSRQARFGRRQFLSWKTPRMTSI
jgi:hypothetical protein